MNICKKILSAALCALLIFVSCIGVSAANTDAIYSADALNHLSLFLGTDLGYELDRGVRRSEGAIMIVRFLGREAEAKVRNYSHPFTDVPEWASAHVGFLYELGFTNGMSDTFFGADHTMSYEQLITFMLRILGYKDEGFGGNDFKWDDPYDLALYCGITDYGFDAPDKNGSAIMRGEMVKLFWNVLECRKTDGVTVKDGIIRYGAFTQNDYDNACSIKEIGKDTWYALNGLVPVPTPTPDPDPTPTPDPKPEPEPEPDPEPEPEEPEDEEEKNWTDNY